MGDTLSASRATADAVGHYGCPVGRGRLVRVGIAPGAKAPEAEELLCPACRGRHLARFIWRKPTERDKGRMPEVLVGGGAAG